ncbi:MAG: hypothetical protein K9G49_14440 [Taibaiella sp.]|nr:hypothetical protein [Taibaiella sp.]
MNVLVFKKNIDNEQMLKKINYLFKDFPQVKEWSVDMQDVDNVLRIYASGSINEKKITQMLNGINILLWRIIMKQKKNLKKLRLLGFIGSMALSIVSCSSSRIANQTDVDQQGWKVVKADKSENPTWVIFRRNEEGSSFYEYKIEGLVEASPENCIASFKQDLYDLSNGVKVDADYKYPTYKILSESSDTIVVYAIHKEPFPLKNTEMCIKYTFDYVKNGNARVQWQEAWADFPLEPSKKLNRIDTFRGSWTFTSTESDVYKASNTVQFDLKAAPIWFAQPMVNKFLVKGYKNFKEDASLKK